MSDLPKLAAFSCEEAFKTAMVSYKYSLLQFDSQKLNIDYYVYLLISLKIKYLENTLLFQFRFQVFHCNFYDL